MQPKNTKAKKRRIEDQLNLELLKETLNRAKAISIGTAFGGTTEIVMRGNGGKFLYVLLQPVEVVELIHQLSANIGCHLILKPREDFSSWRNWKVTDVEKQHLNGWRPFVNDIAPHQSLGASSSNQEFIENNERGQNEPVATKKTVNRRSIKRAAATT